MNRRHIDWNMYPKNIINLHSFTIFQIDLYKLLLWALAYMAQRFVIFAYFVFCPANFFLLVLLLLPFEKPKAWNSF